jgi:hypothetical protein
MRRVKIDTQVISLPDKDVIGVGGEATIFRCNGEALKLYLSPDTAREQKLKAMIPLAGALPSAVIAPRKLAFDEKGKKVVGFTMQLLPSEMTEIRHLSSKKHRAQHNIQTPQIASLFMQIGQTLSQIHQAGMVVGDFNDLNLMFKDTQGLFIDTDSFQFGVYPCMVGTEAFIDPLLYNCDLASAPMFRPEHDWYAFAVLLFKSLLLAHPYGGVHPQVKMLTQRAYNRISVFDSTVTYPKIAYPLELLDDTLLNTFTEWFAKGTRGPFPLDQVQKYASTLKNCPFCGEMYPTSRMRCPHCSNVTAVPVLPPTQGRLVARTQGPIVAWHVEDDTVRWIAHENGKAVFYSLKGMSVTKTLPLFDAIPTAAYAFMDDHVIVAPSPESTDVYGIDVTGAQPEGTLQTSTGLYGQQGERVFGAGGASLYRLANGYLMRGQYRMGQYIEQPVMAIAEDQTWFCVSSDGERVFGSFRVLNAYQYWLLNGRERIDLSLTPLQAGEFVIDTSVKFAVNALLVARHTQHNGVEQIRFDQLTYEGKPLASYTRTDVETFQPLGSHTYARNMLLYATDQGVEREAMDKRQTATFSQTERVVRGGHKLFAYQQGLLVIGEDKLVYVTV